MDDWEVFPREATAVGMKAIEQGVARIKLSKEELYEKASAIIKRARDEAQSLMTQGFIKMPEEYCFGGNVGADFPACLWHGICDFCSLIFAKAKSFRAL